MGPSVPRRGGLFSRALGRWVLRLFGWRIVGDVPDRSRFVVIAAPHTSNWDFVFGIAAKLVLAVDARWLGKDKLFRWPFSRFMRWLGGTPVDRFSPHGVVGQTVELFKRTERLIIGMSPEGTRKKVEKWRTGFYYIALGAQVPILLVYFDYRRKAIGLGPLFFPTGDADKDIGAMRSFYRDKPGKYPDQF